MVNINDIYWAAGFMEGEGCFSTARKARSGFQVTAAQVTLEPLERLVSLFGGAIYPQRTWYVWYCGGTRAAGVAMTLFSLMTKRRKLQITNSLGVWLKRPLANKLKTHCKRGHEFNAENTYIGLNRRGKYRQCRECDRILKRKRYKEKRR